MYLLHLWGSSLAITYTLLCVCWTVITRFGFYAFFQSAYAAYLGIWVGVSLWLECASPTIFQKLLPSSKEYRYFGWMRSVRYVFMTAEFFIYIFNALIVSGLAFSQLNLNRDYIVTICFYWLSVLLILMKVLIMYRRRSEAKFERRFNSHRTRSNAIIGEHLHSALEYELNRNKSVPVDSACTGLMYLRQRKSDLFRKCKNATVVVLCIAYIFLLVGVFVNEALHAKDQRIYPYRQYLHKVKQFSLRPLYVYARCVGTGNLTVVIESDMDRPSLLSLDFLPKILHRTNSDVKICIYDRFGYGWSDSFIHDSIQLPKERRETYILDSILPSLFKEGLLSYPLVYVGFGYGALRVLDFVNSHPKLIDGVVLIDPITFVQESYDENFRLKGSMKQLTQWLNLLPLGWTRVIWYLKQKQLDNFLHFNFTKAMSGKLANEIYASLMRGNTFVTSLHERMIWSENIPKDVDASVQKLIRSQELVSTMCPFLLLERSDTRKYRGSGYKAIALLNSSSTDEAAYTAHGSFEVASYINNFLSSYFLSEDMHRKKNSQKITSKNVSLNEDR